MDGNPLAPDLARLHAAEGARGFLARLADVHDALGGMPPRPERVIMLEEEDEKKPRSNDDGVPGVPATIASRAPRIRAARASAEAPAAVGRDARAVARRRGTNDAHTARRVLEARLAAPPRDFSSRAANPGPPDETNKNRPAFAPRSTRRPFALRRRRASLGGGCVASRLLDAAVLADVRERSSALDELYRLRRDARKAQAAAKARTRWGAAIFSKLDATAQRHARGAQTRAGLLATIESANAEKRAKDEAEFRWMHDVRVFREALSFRAACETAKACRLATYARGGVVFRRGESGEDAVIVVEGRCQLRKEDDDVSSFPGESTTSDDRWGSIAGEASSRHRGGDPSIGGGIKRAKPPAPAWVRDVVSAEAAAADAAAKAEAAGASRGESTSRKVRHGAGACVGLESLLGGAPRTATLVAKSRGVVVAFVPRAAIAKALRDDDANRRAAARRFAASSSSDPSEKSSDPSKKLNDPRTNPTAGTPSARDLLFTLEATRQLEAEHGADAFGDAAGALGADERARAIASRARRLAAGAAALGLGPIPDDSDADKDSPPTHTHAPPRLLGTGPGGISTLDAAGSALAERLRRAKAPFLRDCVTEAELRHVVAAGARRATRRRPRNGGDAVGNAAFLETTNVPGDAATNDNDLFFPANGKDRYPPSNDPSNEPGREPGLDLDPNVDQKLLTAEADPEDLSIAWAVLDGAFAARRAPRAHRRRASAPTRRGDGHRGAGRRSEPRRAAHRREIGGVVDGVADAFRGRGRDGVRRVQGAPPRGGSREARRPGRDVSARREADPRGGGRRGGARRAYGRSRSRRRRGAREALEGVEGVSISVE